MPIEVQEIPIVDEVIWNAWLKKRNLRELRTAARMKISAGALLSLAILAYVIFLLKR